MTAPGVASVANILRGIVAHLVDHPDAVQILSAESEGSTTFTVTSDNRDVGKIIGKQGRTARSLRTILGAISMAEGHHYVISIEGSKPADTDDPAT